MSAQNVHPGVQHLYSNGELGIENHGYQADDLKDAYYYDVIDTTDSSVTTSGTKDSGIYLAMDRCSASVTTISRNSVDGADSKHYDRPEYEELGLPNVTKCDPVYRRDNDVIDYASIDDGAPVASSLSPTDSNHSEGRITRSDGKQQLIRQGHGESFNASKRRSNPLYADDTFLNSKVNGSNSTTCCCWILQLVCFFVSVVAIVISIAAIIALCIERQTMTTRYEELSRRYEEMFEKVQAFSDFNQSMSKTETSAKEFSEQLNYNASQLWSNIIDLQLTMNLLKLENTNFTDSMKVLRQDLTHQINQIPHGLANFSLCSHNLKSIGTSAYAPLSRTETLNLNNSVVLSVVCSTVGGTSAFLEYDSNFPNAYACVCRGQTNSTTTASRYCFIHYWSCPIIA